MKVSVWVVVEVDQLTGKTTSLGDLGIALVLEAGGEKVVGLLAFDRDLGGERGEGRGKRYVEVFLLGVGVKGS